MLGAGMKIEPNTIHISSKGLTVLFGVPTATRKSGQYVLIASKKLGVTYYWIQVLVQAGGWQELG